MSPPASGLASENGRARHQPIAIVGIGCRLPGGANSPQQFWRLMRQGVDAISEVPHERWAAHKFYHPEPAVPGKLYACQGGFIDGAFDFDASFFGISPREALHMDPQQRLVLEVSYEALEDAGLTLERVAGSKAGVFIGISTYEYGASQGMPSEVHLIDGYSNLGGALSIAANRVSHAFDLKGPSLVVDTACSSSLVAVHLACRSLCDRESEIALVGGVNLLLSPPQTMGFCKASMLAPDGRCKPFDASANGYVRAEGVGIVVLKPLDAAMADRDRIYAVVRSTAVNQDGRSSSIAVPDGPAQEAVLRTAYRNAEIDPRHVQYVEAHGTGTPVGDPVEARALGAVLGVGRDADEACLIGSVKSNIGHLESGAGAAGLIKAALCLTHREIPPTLHFTEANESTPLARLGLKVAQRLENWPDPGPRPRIAGVNSFGFGGTNAHVVLEEAPPTEASSGVDECDARAVLLTLSARSREALDAVAQSYRTLLQAKTNEPVPCLAAICQAAALCRSHHDFRLTVSGHSPDEIAGQLSAFLAGEERLTMAFGRRSPAHPPKPAFVFSGMGPQWWGMGQQLFREEPHFRQCIERCDGLLRPLAGWSLIDELMQDEQTSRIQETRVAQPAIFAVQVGLSALWKSWGVEPDAVVGHSVGEVAAAYVAGALTLEDAVHFIYHRSRLQHALEGQGRMLAVGLAAEQARELIEGYRGLVSVAAVNSPRSTTLSGDGDALVDIDHELTAQGVLSRFLHVAVPYHSAAIDPHQDEFLASLQDLNPREVVIDMVSTARPGLVAGPDLTADYWWENARNPVRFQAAMEQLIQSGFNTFVEISAHPVLAPSVAECLAASGGQAAILHSLKRHEPERATVLANLGRLHTIGLPIAWEKLYRQPAGFISLPRYPWQHEHYRRESHELKRWRSGSAWHPLLGERRATARPTWTADVNASAPRFLRDHRVQGAVVYPAAAFIEMALSAMHALGGEEIGVIEDFAIAQALVLSENHEALRLETISDENNRSIAVYSRGIGDFGDWTFHGSGTMLPYHDRPAPDHVPWADLRNRCTRELSQEASYEQLRKVGLQYGPAFQGIDRVWFGEHEGIGEVCDADDVDQSSDYRLSPPLLDACFQVALLTRFHAAADGEQARGLYLPVSFGKLILYRKTHGRMRCHVRIVQSRPNSFAADLRIFDGSGDVVAEVLNARCRALGQLLNDSRTRSEDYLSRYEWRVSRQQNSAAPGAPAELMPSTSSLTQVLKRKLEDLSQDLERTKHSQEVTPQLNALAASFVWSAFQDLGWRPKAGDEVGEQSLIDTLAIPEDRRALLRRLLAFLRNQAVLSRSDGTWTVVVAPPVASPSLLWQDVLRKYPGYCAELLLLNRYGTCLPQLLRGEIGDADILGSKEAAAAVDHLQLDAPTSRIGNLLLREAIESIDKHLNRSLRVLEFGCDSGRSAAYVLPQLSRQRTEYVLAFTGEDTGSRRSLPAESPTVKYVSVDLADDLGDQGLGESTFDLLLLPEGFAALESPQAIVGKLRALLAPGGLMIALEGTGTQDWRDLVLAPLSKLNSTGAEPCQPRFTKRRGVSLLGDAGFEGISAIAEEGAAAEQTMFLGRNPFGGIAPSDSDCELAEFDPDRSWLIFSDGSEFCSALAAALRCQGQIPLIVAPGCEFVQEGEHQYRIRPGEADDIARLIEALSARPEPCAGFIHCWSLSAPQGESMSAAELADAQRLGCLSILHLVQTVEQRSWSGSPRLHVITRGAASVGEAAADSLAAAPAWGLARVLMNEHAHLRTRLIDLDPAAHADEVNMVLAELHPEGREDEVAFRSGLRYVHRLESIPRKALARLAGRSKTGATPTDACAKLSITTPGILEGLSFESVPREFPGPGQVEIRVGAAALNFKDVAKAMGLLGDATLEGTASGWSLGLECCGTVTAVGQGVRRFEVGDEVVGFAAHSLGSHAIADARLIGRRPPQFSREEAATLTLVSMTAYYALHHLARIRSGERILIHSAAGGVGLAAIQLARNAGAEIFATAGSPEKRDFLRSIGIQHVMDSRSLSFAEEIRDLTGGRGADIVLNSLGGDVISRSLSILAPFGRFIELGKRDIERNTALGLRPFQNNLTFFAADLDRLCVERAELAEEVFRDVLEMISDGRLAPLPHRVFPAWRVVDAFRHMAAARHIGKVIVSMDGAQSLVGLPRRRLHVSPEATYLVTGGLSGFGLSTAKWLGERGARHLVLMSRSGASSDEARGAVAALRGGGLDVLVAQGDVTDAEQVRRVLDTIRTTMPPLRGVIHSAMVLDDAVALQLDGGRMQHVLQPKVIGAWNLHQLTRHDDLDFFVMYSSIASLIGSPGQGNYAAANAFLDALCHYRRALALPALTVNWGAIAEVGVAARSAVVQEHFQRLGVSALPPHTALSILEQLLQCDLVQTAVSPASDWSRWMRLLPAAKSPRFREIVRDGSSSGSSLQSGDSLLEVIASTAPEQRIAIVESHLRQTLAAVLGTSPEKLDSERPLLEVGLDSLMMVEILTRIRTELDVEVPPIKFMEGIHLRGLAEYLVEQLPCGSSQIETASVSG